MSQPLSPAALARLAQRRLLKKRPARVATQAQHRTFSPTQRLGRHYEQQAARFLQAHNLHILAQNQHTPFGEIDLIATDHHTLIFVEVRYRQHQLFDGAVASVNRSKQQRIRLSASFLLSHLCRQHFEGKLPSCRFDVIAFHNAEPHWIRHAFT